MTTSASKSDTTTPTTTAPDPMEAALRQAAQAMDNGQDVTDEAIIKASAAKEQGKPAGGTAGEKTASEGSERKAATDATAGKTGESKDGKKKDDKPAGDKTGTDNKDSPEEKARKEEARQKEVLSGFSKKQEALKQQQQELERRERDLQDREQRQRTGSEQQRRNEPKRDKLGYTVAEYENAAKQWEEKGNFEMADLAKDAAKKLRTEEQADSQRQQQQGDGAARRSMPPEQTHGTPEFKAKWDQHLAELEGSEEYSELKNKESELFKATATLLGSEPRLSIFNDGIRIAAEIARGRIAVASVSALRTQLTEANTELEKLRKATSPGAGGTESRGAPKSLENMSAAEQEAELRRAAAEHDNGG